MLIIFIVFTALLLFGVDRLSGSSAELNSAYTSANLFFTHSRLFSHLNHFAKGYGFMLMLSLLLGLTINLNAQTSPQIYVTAGTIPFTVPAGVTSITVECWGGGGSSGNNTDGRARGGGGGGAYTRGTINVVAGATLNVVVGAGGIYNNNANATDDGGQSSAGVIFANGGSRGVVGNNTVILNGGAGGIVSTDPGGVTSFISYAGGNGGNGYVAFDNEGGGGGGESASSTGGGNPGGSTNSATGGAGGTGNAGGGDGGRGSNNDGSPNSTTGNSPGGGGGGRGDDQGNNRDGADGKVILTWTQPPGFCTDNAISVSNHNNVANWNRAIGVPNGQGARLHETNDRLDLDLINNGDLLTAGGSVNVIWRRGSNNNSIIRVEISENAAGPWTLVGNYTNINPRNTWITQPIPLAINMRYIRFTSNNGFDVDIDAISYNTPCAPPCATPAIFNVTGGGCSGGAELPVGLFNSEIGVNYQLFVGATTLVSAMAGTGALLNFGLQAVAGTYTIVSTRTLGGCTANMNGTAIVSVNLPPLQPSTITGIASPCIGSSQTYNVTDVAGVIYDWTLPAADWIQTGGGNSNSIVVTVGSTPGNIIVAPRTACHIGVSQQLPVTPIAATALTPSISANYCFGGGDILLSANGGIAGDTYLWNTGESTKDILVNAADQYNVTMTNAAGCSGSATYSTATELIVNGDFTAGNTSFTSAYTFIPPAPGALVTGNNFTIDVNPNISQIDFWGEDHTTNTGNFMIVNGNSLLTVWTQKVNVIPNTDYKFSAWAISLNDEPLNSNLSFSIDGVEQPLSRTGALPTGAITSAGPFDWVQFEGTWNSLLASGPVDVSIGGVLVAGSAASGFGLDDISFTTLAPIPLIVTVPVSNIVLCEGDQLNLTATVTGGKPFYTYVWTDPVGLVISNNKDHSISNVTIANTGDYTLAVSDGFGCDAVTVITSVTVTPTVTIDAFLPATSTRCQGAGSGTYTTIANNSTGITYTLDAASITGGNSIVATTGVVTYAVGWSGTSIITASAAGCNGPAIATHTVTITPTVGTPVFDLGASSARDQGVGPFTYTATASNSTGITYSLDAASLTGGNTINASTGEVTYTALWSWKSIITATATGCNGTKTEDHIVGVNWCYALFTANGALSCAGASEIYGNVGTFVGATTGFTPPAGIGPGILKNGHIDAEASVASAQAAAQTVAVYNDLAAIPCGATPAGITLAGPTTLTPNVYCYSGALTITGDITLSGGPNAVFIFKINGALTTNTGSNIIMAGGASFRNVYWRVYGAVVLSGDEFKGTIVNEGAFTVNTGAALEGRALSINGAIAITDNVITSDCYPLFTAIDNTKPIFVPPADISECVENLSDVVYDPLTTVINPDRPDYYTFSDLDIRLDLNTALFTDDEPLFCPSNIRWQIDFSLASDLNSPYNLVAQPSITGLGQPSEHIGNILFPGDGVNFNPVVHHITWWIKDCVGNESPPQTRSITINPRPKIVKVN